MVRQFKVRAKYEIVKVRGKCKVLHGVMGLNENCDYNVERQGNRQADSCTDRPHTEHR